MTTTAAHHWNHTGLVGFMDGFVLRNVHHRETLMADRHFERLLEQDFRLFHLLDMPLPDEEPSPKPSISTKISRGIPRTSSRSRTPASHPC